MPNWNGKLFAGIDDGGLDNRKIILGSGYKQPDSDVGRTLTEEKLFAGNFLSRAAFFLMGMWYNANKGHVRITQPCILN